MLAPYATHIVRDSRAFRDFLDWIERQPYVAVDTETSSADDLYRPSFRVRLIQIGNADTAWVFPWDGWGRSAAVALLEFPGRILIHNSAYDMAVLGRQGIRLSWAQVVDTMLALRIAEPTLPSGLKEASNRHLDPLADLSQKDLKQAMARNDWDWDTVPLDLPVFLEYAALDVILTSRLYEHEVVQDALRSPVWGLEMDVAALCAQMSEKGMRIDVGMAERRRDKLMWEANQTRTLIQTGYGLNVGSPAQCAKWLFENPASHGLMTKTTPGGAISADSDVLDGIVAAIPGTQAADLAAGMLSVRRAEKMAKSYFQVFLDYADPDGMVHPQILTSEARSSRMSIRNPALQTLPKDKSHGVRAVVLSRSPGESLISSDWDQIEMRLAAVLSRDENLLDAFRDADLNGGDFFTSMGRTIYRESGFHRDDPRRRIVKNAMYASLYGAGPKKIAITAGISESDAYTVLDGIFRTYPGLRILMSSAERQAKQTGQVKTLGGRVLTVPEGQSYKALNLIIQGSASYLLKRVLVDLACAGLDEYLMLPVHDEVVFSVPQDVVTDVRTLVAEIMPVRDLPLVIGAEPSNPMERWGAEA